MVSRVWLAETAGRLMDPILTMCKLKVMSTYVHGRHGEARVQAHAH